MKAESIFVSIGRISMKNLYSIPIAVVALVVFAPLSAIADTWGDKIDPAFRFTLLPGYGFTAVLDNETGLIWDQMPDPSERTNYLNALAICNRKNVGSRKGWRLPTLQELESLVDPSVPPPGPTLPPGHPFSNVQQNAYWSATSYAGGSSLGWVVRFADAFVDTALKSLDLWVWCVRGGQGVNPE